MSDADSSLRQSRVYTRERGLTLIELIATMAIFGVVLAVAIPQFPRDAFALWGAQTQLLADLRRVRGDALTKGDHFRLQVDDATHYSTYRMTLAGAVWSPSGAPIVNRALPSGVTFVAGVGANFEFNTRGLMVNPSAAQTLDLADAAGHHHDITVWPSGQVAPL
jgi:prepilin-type N-terminal cleavage/methylation domain-containing protein